MSTKSPQNRARNNQFRIRLGRPSDARDIHNSHMNSIRSLCAADYRPRQIAIWGGRPFDEERWKKFISAKTLWVVVDKKNRCHGFGCYSPKKHSSKTACISGLYLDPEVAGRGFGRSLMLRIMEKVKKQKFTKIELESTLTARPFYRHLGFSEMGDVEYSKIGRVKIEGIPMRLKLTEMSL